MAMTVGSNVNPGKKKKSSTMTAKNYTEFKDKDKHGRSSRELETAKSGANGTFASGSAPRVGGDVQKSTTVYNGKGAVAGAKKLKKASTTNATVVRIKKRRG